MRDVGERRGAASALARRSSAGGRVVVVQEDLLERRLAARQRDDRVLGERGDQRADARRVTSKRSALAPAAATCDAGQRRRASGARPAKVTSTVCAREMAQLGERALVDQPARRAGCRRGRTAPRPR